jgi:phenylalanyl-tRNA synthetase beta chain
MTVIADARQVLGIGGIMGGENSGCTEATKTVFLEVALFDPIRVAMAGRRLGIESDARYRFERGVDPASALWGAEVAARLILDLCGGEASELTIAGTSPAGGRRISLRTDRIQTLGGCDVAVDEQRRILDALGFATTLTGSVIEATVPSWRRDVEGEADLVEEIARIWGFERIPPQPLRVEGALPPLAIGPQQQRVRWARRVLASRGMVETVTWSFMASAHADSIWGASDALRLANPISADLDLMRPSILPNLVAAAARNADRGHADSALFEVGPQYRDDSPDGQQTVAAGVFYGQSAERHWAAPQRAVDAFDAKAAALAVLTACRAPVGKLQIAAEAPPWYHPGQSGTLRLGPNALAHFGALHPRVLTLFDARGPAAAFEVFLDAVPEARARKGKSRPLLKIAPFQPVHRDFAFVVDGGVSADRLMTAVRAAERELIVNVQIFDVYTGSRVGADKKSLAVAVTLQPTQRTLTDAEIDAIAAKIVASVAKQTGGVLRT